MDKQLIIWITLSVVILIARFTSFQRWYCVLGGPLGYWKQVWDGKWIKGFPMVWFCLSAFFYIIK